MGVVTDELARVRVTQTADQENVMKDIKRMKSYADAAKSGGIELNIVLKNVRESTNENVTSKVNGVIREGLKLRGIEVEEAVRKETRNSKYPGVIIARCKSVEEKKQILREKKNLRDSRNYKNVYVESDKPLQQRILESNMKLLVDTVGEGQLKLTGSRLQRAGWTRDEGQRRRDDTRNRHAVRSLGGEARAGETPSWSDDRSPSGDRRSYTTRNDNTEARGNVDKQGPRDTTRPSNQHEVTGKGRGRWANQHRQ